MGKTKNKNMLNIPLTLENVGSEGKLITDNMILKIMGSLIGVSLLSLIVTMQLSYRLPKIVCIIAGVVTFMAGMLFMINNVILGGRKILKALEKASKYQVVNTRHFNDIYEEQDGVQLHLDGTCSIFVEIIKGSTMGATDKEIDDYWNTIKEFEDFLLYSGYKFKVINLEDNNIYEESEMMNRQVYNARSISTSLSNNLAIRYKYTKVFMSDAIQYETTVYCISNVTPDTKQFKARVEQRLLEMHNPRLKGVRIMNRREVMDYCTKFFNTKMTDSNVAVETDIKNIITIEE